MKHKQPYTVIFSDLQQKQPPINIHVTSTNRSNVQGDAPGEKLSKRVSDLDINVNTLYGILRIENGYT